MSETIEAAVLEFLESEHADEDAELDALTDPIRERCEASSGRRERARSSKPPMEHAQLNLFGLEYMPGGGLQ